MDRENGLSRKTAKGGTVGNTNGEIGVSRHERPISRGKFLGMGAMAAVAATTTSCQPDEPRPDADGRAPESTVDRRMPLLPSNWAIPAGILNALWSDVFPRLVAKAWLAEDGEDWLWPGMSENELVDSLWRLRTELGGRMGVSTTTWQDLRLQALATPLGWRNIPQGTALKDRVQAIAEYFERDSAVRFQISGTGGYDFLLSEWGVEFFFPAKPKSAADLLRYFAFRNTGRPAIGLPGYMESGMAAVSVDAPTGPSQVVVSPELMSTRVLIESQAIGEGLNRAQLRERLRSGIAQRHSATRQAAPRRESITAYVCSGHTWQMEGTVYRGIMVELPRVIAIGWMEGEEKTYDAPHSYAQRIWLDRKAEFRTIFEERLETMIPAGMKFEFQPAQAAGVLDAVWDSSDMMITHEGFFFPEPPSAIADTSEKKLEKMITAIAEGRAGNPVFTDSKRPDGDE